MQTKTIFEANSNTDEDNWIIIDDVVMGGKSSGNFMFDAQGNAKFYGAISLKNNGGFSSVRYRGATVKAEHLTKISLRIKGDGKRYQFRLKSNANERHSYVNYFTTSGDWETIEIPLKELFPKFRGRKLDIPNFSSNTIAELGFLFGNKKAETFELFIEHIWLQ